MTDSRLPGRWLTDVRFESLSDRAWRTFCGSLMWSNEQGSNGRIPELAMKYLHPRSVDLPTRNELIAAKLWRSVKDGIQVVDWGPAIGQSLAEDVEAQRANNRERQRKHRQRITRDVTRDVTRESLGQDTTGQERPGKDYSEAQIDQQTGEVGSWPVAPIPGSDEWGDPSSPGAILAQRGVA